MRRITWLLLGFLIASFNPDSALAGAGVLAKNVIATLCVIDGATLAVTTLAIGGAGPIAVNERRNRIYVVRMGTADEVTVVDGATLTW